MVVGSNMTDMITYCARAPGPGETIVGERMALGFGGKGANQAVMARSLGSEVAMVTCLGDDANGSSYRKHFESLGINTAHVHTASGVASGAARTGVAAESGQPTQEAALSSAVSHPEARAAREAVGRARRLRPGSQPSGLKGRRVNAGWCAIPFTAIFQVQLPAATPQPYHDFVVRH